MPGTRAVAVGTLCLLAAIHEPASAAESTTGVAVPLGADEAIMVEEKATELRTGELIGLDAFSMEGERIGEVEDLVLGEDQQVTGVVIAVGGFLGIGEKQVGVRWDQAELRPDEDGQQRLIVNLSREELEIAPDYLTAEEQLESAGEVQPAAGTVLPEAEPPSQ